MDDETPIQQITSGVMTHTVDAIVMVSYHKHSQSLSKMEVVADK